MTAIRHTIRYGKEEIAFSLIYASRKTLEIAVHPDCSVVAKAPVGTRIEEVEKRIFKRARWIRRQLRYFYQFNPRTPSRKYIGGETHLYLGRQYRLKMALGSTNELKLSHGYFHICVKHGLPPKKARDLLDNWYFERAKEKFNESLVRCWPYFEKQFLQKPVISIKRLQRRWGSLSKRGTLTLNVDLIRAPRECIDYVITHELCHLRYHDHGSGFYEFMEKVMPDWERRKQKLELALR
jgi:predicted metal-dependent hydrolase